MYGICKNEDDMIVSLHRANVPLTIMDFKAKLLEDKSCVLHWAKISVTPPSIQSPLTDPDFSRTWEYVCFVM